MEQGRTQQVLLITFNYMNYIHDKVHVILFVFYRMNLCVFSLLSIIQSKLVYWTSFLRKSFCGLWDEVVVCIVLGSHQIWKITIQPTVFPTAVACQQNVLSQYHLSLLKGCEVICL